MLKIGTNLVMNISASITNFFLFTSIVAILLMSSVGETPTVASSIPTGIAVAQYTTHPPTIDGQLGDTCWSKAIPLSDFVVTGIASETYSAYDPTSIQILYDKEKLYFGIHCSEHEMPGLSARVQKRDEDLWKDDTIKIYLDPLDDSSNYITFTVNPAGTIRDAKRVSKSACEDISWDADWDVKTARGKDCWAIEVGVPFAQLGLKMPKDGESWGLAIVRDQKSGIAASWGLQKSCWPYPFKGEEFAISRFVTPERFGYIIFPGLVSAEQREVMFTKIIKKEEKEQSLVETRKSDKFLKITKFQTDAVLENAAIKLEFDKNHCAFKITDKLSGQIWLSQSPCIEIRTGEKLCDAKINISDCELNYRKTKNHLQLKLSKCRITNKVLPISITLEMVLAKDRVKFIVKSIEGLEQGAILDVEFPAKLGFARAGENGYLVYPLAMGLLCDFSPERPAREIPNFFYSHGVFGLVMPLFGVVKGDSGLAAVVKTPFDATLSWWINSVGIYSLSPGWRFEGERLNYKREIHYFPLPKATYVDIAKVYRSELIREKRYVTLREKAKDNPYVTMLPGTVAEEWRRLRKFYRRKVISPEFHEAYPTVSIRGIFDHAYRKGFDRVNAWICGRREERENVNIREAVEYARSLSPGYTLSVYDNYFNRQNNDAISKHRDGNPIKCWYSGNYKWLLSTCPIERLKEAKQRASLLTNLIGKGCLYVDIEGATVLRECFDPRHPVTKEQDAHYRRELFKHVRKCQGAVATEGVPHDFLCDVIDIGAYLKFHRFSKGPLLIKPPVILVPLFRLVYHGSILNMTPSDSGYYMCSPPYMPLYGFIPDTFDDKGLRNSYKMRETAYAEMINHKFLTGPRISTEKPFNPDRPRDSFHTDDVQLSEFSDGTIVIANFRDIPYEYQGETVPAHDFRVMKKELKLKMTSEMVSQSVWKDEGIFKVTLSVKNISKQNLTNLHFSLEVQKSLEKKVKISPITAIKFNSLSPDSMVNSTYRISASVEAGQKILLISKLKYRFGKENRIVTELLHLRLKPQWMAPFIRFGDER